MITLATMPSIFSRAGLEWVLRCCLFLLCIFTNTALAQRATLAGTLIENQASISFTTADGNTYNALSNVASIVTRSIYSINLIPDAGNTSSVGAPTSNFTLPVAPSNNRIGNPGSSATLVYTLENSGNASDTITLSLIQDTTDAFNLENLLLYRDANGNAILDAGEPLITGSVTLAPNAKINIFAVGTIPTTAASNAVTRIDLQARSSDTTLWDNNNLGSVTVVRDAAPVLAKSATEPDLTGLIEYQIFGNNIGQRAARSIASVVRVDGNPLDGILLTDSIPAGTQLEIRNPATASTGTGFGSLIIYQTNGLWSSIPNPRATIIGLLLRDPHSTDALPEDTFAVGSSFQFSFFVRVLNTVQGGTRIRNVAQLEYGDATDSKRQVLSNEAVSSVFERSGISILPRDGLTSGTYMFTEPTTGKTWNITRTGDNTNQTDSQSIVNVPGGIAVSFVNTIQNTGNIADTFSLELDTSSDLQGATLQFLDETMLLPRNSVRLLPNEQIDLVVRIVLPLNFTNIKAVLRTKASLSTLSDISTNIVVAASSAAIWIGPLGQATVNEYPDPLDSQSQEIFVGANANYNFSVLNASSFTDTLELNLESVLPTGWTTRFLAADGSVLLDTNNNGKPELSNMTAGETRAMTLQVIPPTGTVGNNAGNGWQAVLRLQSILAPRLQNRTLSILSRIRPSSDAFTLEKKVSAARVNQGTTLEFNLTWRNVSGSVQNNVVITDILSALLEMPSNISSNGTFDAVSKTLTWRFNNVAINESKTLSFLAKVRVDTPDLERILNTASISSQAVVIPVVSNTTQTDVLGSILQLEKSALQTVVSIGGSIDYELRIRNASQNAKLENLTLTDTMPVGIVYKLGSSRLGDIPLEPTVTVQSGVQVLTWAIGTLNANTTLRIRLVGLVTPNAPERVENRAIATAIGGANKISVTSNNAIAAVKVEASIFGRASAILGRIFFDKNRNRMFDGSDYPLAHARIYLSNGAYTISDSQGRYSFPELQPGLYALRLDPLSAPWTLQSMPGDTNVGTRHVSINDPAPQQIDFPLLAPEAQLQKSRRTTLTMGIANLEKQVVAGGAGYAVNLVLQLQQNVANLRLTDPLPIGAERKQLEVQNAAGQTVNFSIAEDGALLFAQLEAGTYRIRYALLTNVAAERACTDPDLYWDEVLP